MVERGGNAAGDVHAANGVAKSRQPLSDRAAQLRRREGVADGAPRPEHGAVVAANLPLRALVAVGGAPGINDVGIDRADVFHVDLQLLSLLGQVVGEEHIGGGGDAVKQLPPRLGGKVHPHAALAPVGVFHHRIALRRDGDPAEFEKAALGVAAHRVFDLDDVGAPVRENGPRRRHEGVLRHFEDAHAL